jgi:NADH:ubiquinone oxidoreductase subunit 6 (subunit J)
LFVLAYLGEQALADEDRLERFEVFSWITILVITAMGAIVMFTTALPAFHDVPETTDDIGSPRAVGFAFLREHLLPFEATSLVLLVGAVGAVVLAKRAVLAEGGR